MTLQEVVDGFLKTFAKGAQKPARARARGRDWGRCALVQCCPQRLVLGLQTCLDYFANALLVGRGQFTFEVFDALVGASFRFACSSSSTIDLWFM